MTVSRLAIIDEARRWMGTPFHHQASLRGVGCDCIGLIVGVVSALGLPEADDIKADPRFRGYGRLPDGESLRQGCADHADEIAPGDADVGDVLLFTFVKEPMHVAFVSARDPQYVIHAYQPVGRVVENIVDAKWQRRIVAAYRLRGVG